VRGRVSGGLDSLVMGEGQILAQVRQVYKVGQAAPGFGRHLNGLFKQAITAGKRVRAETSIASGAVSVSSAAAELAQLKLPSHDFADAQARARSCRRPLPVRGQLGACPVAWVRGGSSRRGVRRGVTSRGAQVCIIGAGKMSRLLVKHLASKGCERVTMLNRSRPRAEALAEEFPEVAFDIRLMPDLLPCVAAADVIFAASGSEELLVHKADLASAHPRAHVALYASQRTGVGCCSCGGRCISSISLLCYNTMPD